MALTKGAGYAGFRSTPCPIVYCEDNARYVEYCGAGECVGLYYTCINLYLTPESPPGADVLRGTPPSREPSSQKTLRRSGMDPNVQFRDGGVTPPDPDGERRRSGPPPDNSIGSPRRARSVFAAGRDGTTPALRRRH